MYRLHTFNSEFYFTISTEIIIVDKPADFVHIHTLTMNKLCISDLLQQVILLLSMVYDKKSMKTNLYFKCQKVMKGDVFPDVF